MSITCWQPRLPSFAQKGYLGLLLMGCGGIAEQRGVDLGSARGGQASATTPGSSIAAVGGASVLGGATSRAAGGAAAQVVGGRPANGGMTSTTGGAARNGGAAGRQVFTAGVAGAVTFAGRAAVGGSAGTGHGLTGGTTGYGGAAAAGSSGAAAAGSSGAGGDCVNVCGLYGAPCCNWAAHCLNPMGSCQLSILNASEAAYDYVDLEQKLASVAEDVLLSVSDGDLSWAAADPMPAARIELRLSDEASTRLGKAIEAARYHSFSLSCNGQRLFFGIGYDWYGAAAIRTPVLHVERSSEGQMILRLGAWLGSWMGLPADAAAKHRLDQTVFRGVLCRRGVLHELAPDAKPAL